MENPLEIAFHNMPSSKDLSAEIAKRAAKLEKLYGRLIGCRVVVERLSKPNRNGITYQVHIEMQAPRGTLVVSHEPHHIKDRHAPTDGLSTVQAAFDAADAQLRAFSTKHRAKSRKSRGLRGTIADRDSEVHAG